jgi:tRNA 2-thiouridine synthesizing protein A
LVAQAALTNAMTAEPEIYDLKGLKCPLPVLKARARLRGQTAGTQTWLVTTDPLAVIDIPNFCRENGHTLVETRSEPGGHRFLVTRGDT